MSPAYAACRIRGSANCCSSNDRTADEPVVGIVLTLDPDLIGCAMLGDDSGIGAGNLVRATGSVASVPVGDKLLGRTVNALGVPMDGGPEIEAAGIEPVERPAPAIVDRDFVNTALNTGLLVIDAMLAARPWPARTDHRRSRDRQDRDSD